MLQEPTADTLPRQPFLLFPPRTLYHPALTRIFAPNIRHHDTQNPAINRKKGQPAHKKPWHERALAQELEPVGLLKPQDLRKGSKTQSWLDVEA